jgi:hypothetical protein
VGRNFLVKLRQNRHCLGEKFIRDADQSSHLASLVLQDERSRRERSGGETSAGESGCCRRALADPIVERLLAGSSGTTFITSGNWSEKIDQAVR